MPKVKCESCGKEVERFPSQIKGHIFCGDCWFKGSQAVRCDFCQKEIKKYRSAIRGQHVFCSRSHNMLYNYAFGRLDKIIDNNRRRGRFGKYTEMRAWRAYKWIEKRIVARPKYEKRRRKIIKLDTEKSAWRLLKLLELHNGLRKYSSHGNAFAKLRDVRNRNCYLREARAMLEGKDTWGKNRCTKLIGDEDYGT